MKAENWEPSEPILIVWDEGKWHVCRVDAVVHVQDRDIDEMVYHCDRPIVNDADTLGEAILKAMVEDARAATNPETGF